MTRTKIALTQTKFLRYFCTRYEQKHPNENTPTPNIPNDTATDTEENPASLIIHTGNKGIWI